jgi:hypothetical protein
MQVTSLEANPVARCRRVYAHAHDYHINSISNNRSVASYVEFLFSMGSLWHYSFSNMLIQLLLHFACFQTYNQQTSEAYFWEESVFGICLVI